MERKWVLRFLEIADRVATWSKDPSSQVGSVIVDDQRRLIGAGFNGFPRGVSDDPSLYEDRDAKMHLVQHAEANAITQATASVRGAILFATHPPCANCAGLIVQAGIARVFSWSPPPGFFVRNSESLQSAAFIFREAGVPLSQIPQKDSD